MNIDTDYDYDFEDEEPSYVKARTKRSSITSKKPVTKESYERNADVQRWLKEQTSQDADEKPAFNPTFLASKRDGSWIRSSLAHFYEQDLITDVIHVVKSGKEATVYCCTAHPSTGLEYVAAKVYRPRMFRSLKNDAVYREGRTQRDQQGSVRHSTHLRLDLKKSEKGRVARINTWIEYEFQTQHRLYNVGANVPKPLAQVGNAVLMEYIGNVDDPAPLLREVTLPQDRVQEVFASILSNIELWLANDRIHGDLSEYNILYWQDKATIIDFAQAIDPHYNQEVFPLFARDIERVCEYFAKYGVESNPQTIALDLWARHIEPVI